MTSSLRELREPALRALAERIRERDATQLAARYREDATLSVPGLAEVRGRDAIARYYGDWLGAFADIAFGFRRVFAKGDVVVAEWAWSGTNTGAFMGQQPTNRTGGALGASVLLLDPEGAIAAEHRYTDAATVAGQLGLLKEGKHFRPTPTVPTSTVWVTSTGRPEEERNLDPIKAIHAAVDGKSEEDYLGALAESVDYDDLTRPEAFHGQQGAKRELRAFLGAFPDARFKHLNAWCIGEYAIVESMMTGTLHGALGAATRKPVNVHALDIGRIEGGKYAQGVTYGDRFEMWSQLGFTEKTAPARLSPWRDPPS